MLGTKKRDTSYLVHHILVASCFMMPTSFAMGVVWVVLTPGRTLTTRGGSTPTPSSTAAPTSSAGGQVFKHGLDMF